MNLSRAATPLLLSALSALSALVSGSALAQQPPAPVAPAPAAPVPVAPTPVAPTPVALEEEPAPAEAAPVDQPAEGATAAGMPAPALPPGAQPVPASGFVVPPPGGFGTAPTPARSGAFEHGDLAPEPPRPLVSESRFQLLGVVERQWNTDPSFDLFSDSNGAGMGGLSAGYAVVSTPQWAVVPELGWGRLDASRKATFGGGIEEATLVDDRFHAGVSLRYVLAPVFEPHVRVSGGLDVVNATIDAQSTPTLGQEELAPFGTIGAGFTLHTSPGGLSRRGLTRTLLLGVTLEGGYSLSPSIELDPKPEGGSPRVSTSDVSFGSLARSGPYLRIGATIRL